MAKTVKSVLMIDFDSVRRSLDRIDPLAGAGFATRSGDWLEAFERGELITPRKPRRILIRRCFADPEMLEDGSADLIAAGFDIVECPPRSGGRSSAEVHLAIDAVDALGSDADYDEFIILSGESDLAPLLMRLKGDNRATAIYSDAGAKPGQDQFADGILTAQVLAEFIAGDDTEGLQPVSRDKIEAFARRVCAATSVPLLSPRSYGELFRHLAHEIGTNGYSFQTTAKSVADRLSEAGRNVARRQVVFVVKGLAFKGHVFSKDDSAEVLAAVFMEQARYLIKSAGVKLDGSDERLLNAWLVQRAKAQSKPAGNAEPKPGTSGAPTDALKHSKKKTRPPRPAVKKKAARPEPSPPPAPASTPPVAPGNEVPIPAPPDMRADAAVREENRKGRTAGEIKADIAARISRSLREKKAARSKREAEETASPAKPKGRRKSSPPSRAREPAPPRAEEPVLPRAEEPPPPDMPAPKEDTPQIDSAPLESSILAAIAEAVDVLVEGDADTPATGTPVTDTPVRDASQDSKTAEPAAQPPSAPASEEGEESDDIGDEIQRIIASYQRDRDPEAK
ncbi:MAG: NYN domain-containing protein [Alphaproteobacteria bacterium]